MTHQGAPDKFLEMVPAHAATPLHIAFTADEAYSVGLAAAVQSVAESLHNFSRTAEIWILDFGISQQSKRWLLRIQDMLKQPRMDLTTISSSKKAVQSPGILIHIVAPTFMGPVGELLSQLPAMGYASSVTWAKLFLPGLLPSTAVDDHGLLLYLDSDVLVAPGTDIGQIWDAWIQVR